MAGYQDAFYLSLLGLAESFRCSSPCQPRHCIRCLNAIFYFNPPPRIEARVHIHLGNMYLLYSKNLDVARMHLEKAFGICQNQTSFEDAIAECACLLGETYLKLQVHMLDRDYATACSILNTGSTLAQHEDAAYLEILFLLSKSMLLIIERKVQDAHPALYRTGQLIDGWSGNPTYKEALKSFFLILQVCHFLLAGEAKSGKPCLRELQVSIQSLAQLDKHGPKPPYPTELFHWISKDNLCILVYLVTVLCAMQCGQYEKAQKYTDRALAQIDKIKANDPTNELTWKLQVILLEHSAMCHLSVANYSLSIQQIDTICSICNRFPNFLIQHGSQIHCLLGLYAISMNCTTAAETQFNSALRLARDAQLWTFVNLNLALLYLRDGRESDFYGLADRINPENVQNFSACLRAAACFLKGLHLFMQSRLSESKRILRDALTLANKEDMNKISSLTLILLGRLFFSINRTPEGFEETVKVMNAAVQMARSVPDVECQLWASSLLKALYQYSGDREKESECHGCYSALYKRTLKSLTDSMALPEHQLINWSDGNVPVQSESAT